jgi:hypothetical protein
MKKFFLFCLIVLSNYTINAQESAVKVNPFAFLWGSDLVSYERMITDNSSGIIGVGVGGYNFGGAKYSNTGAEIQYRRYFEEVLNGWYAGGFAAYTSGKVEIEGSSFLPGFGVEDNETKFTSIRIGAKGGYQWIWDSGFLLDLNLGFAYSKFNYDNSDSTFSSLKASGVLPSGSIAIGYSF